jgi:hypothetical protein
VEGNVREYVRLLRERLDRLEFEAKARDVVISALLQTHPDPAAVADELEERSSGITLLSIMGGGGDTQVDAVRYLEDSIAALRARSAAS